LKDCPIKTYSQNRLILLVSILLILVDNFTFFRHTIEAYPLHTHIGFLFSVAVVLFALTALVFTLLSSKWTSKPLLILTLLISSMAGYFMDTYHVIIDDSMIRNILQTDIKESLDLLSLKQGLYLLFFGIIPAYIVYKIPIKYVSTKQALWQKFTQIVILILLITINIFIFSKHYTTFLREHKPLRFSSNPVYWFYSIGKYIQGTFHGDSIVMQVLGEDAKIISNDTDRHKIIIMVVGEAARADHFSLNSYSKETNPLLKQEDILNFPHVSSCGTSTAVAVPCMFSIYKRKNYSYKKAIRTENVLDVLHHSKQVALLWRDNNSDSKGVALRIPYQQYKSPQNNTLCEEGECRDIGMLVGLEAYIEKQKNKDILIILHQMGNHGPAYYKRYPKSFETFTPVCQTNQLEACSKEEINNAYDNAILYTDYFLTQTIHLLKKYTHTHKTAMLYMSDHGESLGENGIYLHGLPYFMAPSAQTHIAAMVWMNRSLKQSIKPIDTDKSYTQDNLFHSLLGLFEVETKVYDKTLDIFH